MSRQPGARLLGRVSGVAALLLVWEAAALAVGTELILPSPRRVLAELPALLGDPAGLASLGLTFLRGLEAFGLSLVTGLLAGYAAGRRPFIEGLLSPLVVTVRATPVLALILLFLLWFPAGFVPVFAALLMAFPVVYTNAMAGARSTPPELLEMATLFGVPSRTVLLELRLPSALPHVLAGARAALGLCWKVVVAGEVLAQPALALGSRMQAARTLIETPRVFAWALAAILLCGASEWLFGLAVSRGGRDHG